MRIILSTAASAAALVLALVLVAAVVDEAKASKHQPVKVTSLLANDAVLDRYAAAVAATEPLREDRDRVLRENVSPLKYWWAKATKGGLGVDADALTAQGPRSDRIRKAYTFHVVQSGRIIKSMGLSIQDFNTITRRLAQDPRLRQRVLKQAYLYRLEAKINDKLLTASVEEEDAISGRYGFSSPSNSNALTENDAEDKLSSPSSNTNSKFGGLFSSFSSSNGPTPVSSSKKEQAMPAFASSAAASASAAAAAANGAAAAEQEEEELAWSGNGASTRHHRNRGPKRIALFAQSLREIEKLRAEQTLHLKREYAIDSLPDISARPELLNLLHPKVQQMCRQFPVQAGEIASRHGFQPQEFDSLLSKARGNALFRWRVNRLMGPTPAAAFGGPGAAFQY